MKKRNKTLVSILPFLFSFLSFVFFAFIFGNYFFEVKAQSRPEQSCSGDVNDDNQVDDSDLSILVKNLFQEVDLKNQKSDLASAKFDNQKYIIRGYGDQQIDIWDYLQVKTNFGLDCSSGGGSNAEICDNDIDDDGDGDTDCADDDCANSSDCAIEPVVEICDNGVDDDQNGYTDCSDSYCDYQSCGVGCLCSNREKTEKICSDEIDNDGDGDTDCADDDCASHEACVGSKEICNNREDDDGDRFVDCADDECFSESCGTGCKCGLSVKIETNCDDATDNDGDGSTDCLDTDCSKVCDNEPGGLPITF